MITKTEIDSLSAMVPKGWTAEIYESAGRNYKRAIDPDGCRWYWEGEWILNVPYFRGLDIALVDHVAGPRPFPISGPGLITIGKRKISPKKWNY